ncbi:MAG: ECF-type sigma factor [Planctomycetota bacterium]
MHEITELLRRLEHEESLSTEQLLPLVYQELRQLAEAKMQREKPGQTLDATGLVHEAFLRLVAEDAKWESRRHFFGAAAEAMRRILIDRARAKQAKKRGGGLKRVLLEEIPVAAEDDRMLVLSNAVVELERALPEKAELVKLRFFAGLSIRDAAEVLSISTAKADRQWAYSRAWLQAWVEDHA